MNQRFTIDISFNKLKSSNDFWNLYMIGFASITAVQEILNISIFVYLNYALVGIALLFANAENMRSLFIFFILFSSENTLYTVNVIFSVLYVYKTYKDIKITNSVKLIGLLVSWELLHGITYIIFQYKIIYFIQEMGFALVMFANILFIIHTDIKKEYMRMAHIFVYASVASCTIFYIKYIQYFGVKYAFDFSAGIGRLSDGLNAFKKNPNMVSRTCAFAFAIVLALLLLRWASCSLKQKIVYVMCLVLVFFLGMTSGSTSFYLGVFVAVAWMMVSIIHDYPAGKAMALTYVLVTIIVIALSLVSVLAPKAVRRLTSDLNADDVSHGRTTMWLEYSKLFVEHPWFFFVGVGLQDYFRKVNNWTGREDLFATHNLIFEMLVAWGFIGTTIFVILIYKLLKETSLVPKNRCYISLIPALTILAVIQTGNFFYGYYTNMIFVNLSVLSVGYMNWFYEHTSL